MPAGASLPHSRGLDWQLLYDDDFDRDRLGQIWQGRSDVHWRSSEWKIVDGVVMPEDSWTALAFARTIKPPVRIEYDVYSRTEGVRILGTMLCPQGLSTHRFWGKMDGYGYFLSLGWHDRLSNSIMRNDSEILIDAQGMQLEKDRRYRIVAQFVPPFVELYVDGKQVLQYEDGNWLEGLDELVLYSYPVHAFDNVRIYLAEQ